MTYADGTEPVKLHKHATTHGNARTAATLISHLRTLHPADHRPSQHGTRIAFDDPVGVASLLWSLRRVGADGQVAALLARDPAVHASLDDANAVASLLYGLREVGADGQAAALAERLPAAGHFDQCIKISGHWERFRFGREPDGRVAVPWTWDDPE
ncbi:hypothetical protein [Streptomyces sp. NPDC059008]|uniref:hypothetical protein n=1 Tax=Streptomyces sp. NPDC059008 TaxID=3346693 RepID=UPI003691BF58